MGRSTAGQAARRGEPCVQPASRHACSPHRSACAVAMALPAPVFGLDSCRSRRIWKPNVVKSHLYSEALNQKVPLLVTTTALRWACCEGRLGAALTCCPLRPACEQRTRYTALAGIGACRAAAHCISCPDVAT